MAAFGGSFFRPLLARSQDSLQAFLIGLWLGLGDTLAATLHLFICLSSRPANACRKLRLFCFHRRLGVRLVSGGFEPVRRIDHRQQITRQSTGFSTHAIAACDGQRADVSLVDRAAYFVW